jgi:hypothetical protein
VYNGNTGATVTAGTLVGVASGETVTVSATATYNSATVGTGKTITVVYTLGGADAANYIKPIDYTATGTITAGSGGGGGGGSSSATCTSVTYGAYAAACFNGYQYRNVEARTPSNCILTAAQQEAAKKACNVVDEATSVTVTGAGVISGGSSDSSASFIATEKNLVKKINKVLAKRLSGRILLQVESKGEAWYVSPVNQAKYFLGRPADAFSIMRKLGLGISNKNFDSYKGKAPARLAGRILLKVESHGEAYYVNPVDLKMHYLGRPADAFSVMRTLGLGINNTNLRQISVEEVK